jgi:hypothetical protein
MAVCCQNLTPGVFSSHSALSLMVGALFKKFDLFLNTPCIFGVRWNVRLLGRSPLCAANRVSHSNISVSNPSYLSLTVPWMEVDIEIYDRWL